MKRMLAPLALLIALGAFCAGSVWRVDMVCRASAALLEQAETRCLLGDMEDAARLTREAWAVWNRHEGLLGVALRHTESDEVAVLYPLLAENCRRGNENEYMQENLELQARLRALSRMEKPYYFHIL